MSARDAQKTVVGQTARGMICPLQAEPSRPLHLATTYEVFAWKMPQKQCIDQFQDGEQTASIVMIQSMIRAFYNLDGKKVDKVSKLG